MESIIGYDVESLAEDIASLEPHMETGKSIRIIICSERLPTSEELAEFVTNVQKAGFVVSGPVTGIENGVPTTALKMTMNRKVTGAGIPLGAWQLILPLVIPLATIGVVTYGITKLQTISSSLVPILLITGGVVVLVAAAAAKPAQAYVERGGKIPYLP